MILFIAIVYGVSIAFFAGEYASSRRRRKRQVAPLMPPCPDVSDLKHDGTWLSQRSLLNAIYDRAVADEDSAPHIIIRRK